MRSGNVVLVGAGPGHVDFLTIAGLKAIQAAEVILYDALLAPDIRRLFPSKAKTLYVGKRCGQHALKQNQINDLLVSYARSGYQVVRLKGGDPFIFGRGAEEVEALREAHISYQIVPGISALNGIAAQVGLPLTSRSDANEFRALQGHTLPSDPSYWQDLARYKGTVVIFMGIENLPAIALRLREAGADRETLLAVIETDDEGHPQVTQSNLQSVIEFGFDRKTQGPGIIYLGPNVKLMNSQAAVIDLDSTSNQEIGHGSVLTYIS